MSIFIPFNNQPASVSVQTGAYVIPAGSYARVTVSLSANARGKAVKTGIGYLTSPPDVLQYTSDSMSKTAVFFVPSGASLSVSTNTANIVASGNNTTDILHVDDFSSASFNIGGTISLEVTAMASCTLRNQNNSSTDFLSAYVDGDSDARYIVELFPELS